MKETNDVRLIDKTADYYGVPVGVKDPADKVKKYVEKFGSEPEYIIYRPYIVLMGPIREKVVAQIHTPKTYEK